MGLAERRAVEHFKTDDFPGWMSKITKAAGFEVPVEVSWEALAVPDYASSYADFFGKVYFQPLVDALNGIAFDELGRNALRDGLEKIVITNTDEFYNTRGFTFAGGVLTLDHQPNTNVDDVEERAKGLQRILESGL
jgi:hypothetical protein